MKKKILMISISLTVMVVLGIAHRLIAQSIQTEAKDSPVQSTLRHSQESNYARDCVQARGYCFSKEYIQQGIYLHK